MAVMDGSAREASGKTGLIVGASGGVGRAMVEQLLQDERFNVVHAWARRTEGLAELGAQVRRVDILDEDSITQAAAQISRLDRVVVATGLLHDEAAGVQPEKSMRDLSLERLTRVFQVNAIGPALVGKHVLVKLSDEPGSVFAAISARVSSIDDNRLGGWYGYRASKSALNQFIKTFSIEVARRKPQAICVGLHPGTVDTGLSKPFQRNVPDRQLFTPAESARHLLGVLDKLSPEDTGGLFAWDGSKIPF